MRTIRVQKRKKEVPPDRYGIKHAVDAAISAQWTPVLKQICDELKCEQSVKEPAVKNQCSSL